MFVVQIVGDRNHLVVPAIPGTSLVASNQENGCSLRIEGEQDPDRRRRSQLPVLMSRLLDEIR
jgi:hypothetical protein